MAVAAVAMALQPDRAMAGVLLLSLLAAGPLMRVFGDKVEAVITRLLGVILAALAAPVA